MSNQLIAFDFGGTLGEMDIVSHKFEPVYVDLVPALREAKAKRPSLFFGIATNGSGETPLHFLQRNGAVDLFTNGSGDSLVLHGYQLIVEKVTTERNFPLNFRERILGKRSGIEMVESEVGSFLEPKPYGRMLHHMLRLAGVESPENAVFIGDSRYDDGGEASAVGVDYIHVGNGSKPKSMHALLDMAFQRLD